MSIEVRRISKTFGSFAALRDVSLQVPTGKLVALLGPSGSGKTTLLRIVAGLEFPDAGSGPVLFHNEDVARTRAGARRVGFVFQHYALFRHMSVFENVAFGLRVRPRRQRPSRAAIRAKVMRLLELVQLVVQAPQPRAQLLAHACIQRAERLVQQQDARLDRQRPRQRHALPLPAR